MQERTRGGSKNKGATRAFVHDIRYRLSCQNRKISKLRNVVDHTAGQFFSEQAVGKWSQPSCSALLYTRLLPAYFWSLCPARRKRDKILRNSTQSSLEGLSQEVAYLVNSAERGPGKCNLALGSSPMLGQNTVAFEQWGHKTGSRPDNSLT